MESVLLEMPDGELKKKKLFTNCVQDSLVSHAKARILTQMS